MGIRLGLMGFGRIGRNIFRILYQRDDVEVVAISDIADHKGLEYLLRYDTIMGRFPDEVSVQDDKLFVCGKEIQMLSGREPGDVDWGALDVDIVVEATGIFRTREQIEQHMTAGAEKVILTVPSKDEIDFTEVLGVNEDELKPEHKIVSNASCTTNCLAPVAKIIHENFGIESGVMTTVHAYTNDQRLADVPHSDWRRSRAAAENIIPTTTGAAKAVGKVIPELQGKLDGMASRVPVPDGSIVDLVVEVERDVTVADIHAAVRVAAFAVT